MAVLLDAQGVEHVFEVAGGTIAPLLDAIHRRGTPRLVSVRHEQAAAFAAEGAARMRGVPGVALATSGPGATNLLTGVASCHFDSVPAVFVTGQVATAELGGERDVRQRSFQETDVVAMATPVTKAAWRVGSAAELPGRLAAAFALARDGRPGPVLVDLPMDLQGADVPPPADDAPVRAAAPLPDPEGLDRALADLRAARRPLILVGGGVRTAGATDDLRRLVAALGVPVVHSLLGVDALPFDDPLRVGMIGTYGNRWANMALGAADVLLVLGSRLDIRQTGADTAAFAARTIHHVDCDPAEVNRRVTGCHAVDADLAAFLRAAVERAPAAAAAGGWRDEVAALRERWPDVAELAGVPGINPNALMHALSRASGDAAAFVTDVGQHQMWAAQSLRLGAGQRFLTSGGMGAMGFGLPAAIGAALACAAPVVLVAGDGGFQLNLQELQTVAHHGLPLKMVILDNGSHGMVRQFQETYFDGRYPSTRWGYSAPDVARVAAAFGIPATTVSRPDELDAALAATWRDPARPHLLRVHIDGDANAYPKLAFGRPITEMEPLAAPIPLRRGR
nr:thiamine pyrophosphate-binding protein [Patulibacter sp. SYSU D01012]